MSFPIKNCDFPIKNGTCSSSNGWKLGVLNHPVLISQLYHGMRGTWTLHEREDSGKMGKSAGSPGISWWTMVEKPCLKKTCSQKPVQPLTNKFSILPIAQLLIFLMVKAPSVPMNSAWATPLAGLMWAQRQLGETKAVMRHDLQQPQPQWIIVIANILGFNWSMGISGS